MTDAWRFVRSDLTVPAQLTVRCSVNPAVPYAQVIVQELCESRGGRPDEPYGFRGRKAILNHASALVSACP